MELEYCKCGSTFYEAYGGLVSNVCFYCHKIIQDE